MVRDDIVGRAGFETGDRDDDRGERVGIACRDRLQIADDLRAYQDRIYGPVRLRRMAAAPPDGDGTLVGSRHDGAAANGELADRNARHVVHAIDFLDAETDRKS